MSRNSDGKCPDKGAFCSAIRDWCDGECEIVRYERMEAELKRLRKAVEPLLAIDLSRCSPLPWRCKVQNYPIADTGDYWGACFVEDAAASPSREPIAVKTDADDYRPVEKEDGDYDADMLAIAECVNAVAEAQKILKGDKPQ